VELTGATGAINRPRSYAMVLHQGGRAKRSHVGTGATSVGKQVREIARAQCHMSAVEPIQQVWWARQMVGKRQSDHVRPRVQDHVVTMEARISK
jgi:hypothetical protein